ncbi:MAG: hypothetical protein V1913_13835 [Fibrobacterota bacterium]
MDTDKTPVKCAHVWIDGPIDFGLSFACEIKNEEIPELIKDWRSFLFDRGFVSTQHCSICFLEKFKRDGKIHYNTYWQKELRLNKEMVGAYYRQLREANNPVHYRDFIPFWEEKADLLKENFSYKNK